MRCIPSSGVAYFLAGSSFTHEDDQLFGFLRLTLEF